MQIHTTLSPDNEDHIQSSVKVLTQGDSFDLMLQLEGGGRSIKCHLTTYDPTSWTIIRGYMERTSGFVDEVFVRIAATQGVLFKTSELAKLLLSLPGGENIRGQLEKYTSDEAQLQA